MMKFVRNSFALLPFFIQIACAQNTGTLDIPGTDASTTAPKVVKTQSVAAEKKQQADKAVNPKVAVKDVGQKAIDVPGVMKVDGVDGGAMDFSRTQILTMSNGSIRTVNVNDTTWNLLQLPFSSYQWLATDAIIVKRPFDNSVNVYFQFNNKFKPTPTQVFIESDSGIVYGLELIPKAIPAQRLLVKDDSLSSGGKPVGKANSFETQVQAWFDAAEHGTPPPEFSVVDLDGQTMSKNGLVLKASKQFSNAKYDIYELVVTNPLERNVILEEKEFDGPYVVAVEFPDGPAIKPGKSSKIYILARKRSK